MPASDAHVLWCPSCRRGTECAPLPQLEADEAYIHAVAPGGPRGFHRRHYCLECREIWDSVQVPVEYLQRLLEQVERTDDLDREVASLKFVLAQDRRQQQLLERAA